MPRYIAGVDFGGTWTKAVLVDMRGRIVRKAMERTGSRMNRDEVMSNIEKATESVISGTHRRDIRGIGVGAPGIVENGRIKVLPNVPAFRNFPMEKRIGFRFNLPVRVENDGNCVALGESMLGAGKGVRDMVCITVGTGVGCGIVIGGKLYRGRGAAGELSHLTVEPDGWRCGCGSTGCLEEYVSSGAIERLAMKNGLKGDPKEIVTLAKKGNMRAGDVYAEAGRYLGIGISGIIKILDPDLILIGGGISKSGNLLLKPARDEIKKRTFFSPPQIKTVKLKDWAGAVGAACLFLE